MIKLAKMKNIAVVNAGGLFVQWGDVIVNTWKPCRMFRAREIGFVAGRRMGKNVMMQAIAELISEMEREARGNRGSVF